MMTAEQIERLNSHYWSCANQHVGAGIVKELQDEHDRLETENAELKADNESLNEANVALYGANEHFYAENKRLNELVAMYRWASSMSCGGCPMPDSCLQQTEEMPCTSIEQHEEAWISAYKQAQAGKGSI